MKRSTGSGNKRKLTTVSKGDEDSKKNKNEDEIGETATLERMSEDSKILYGYLPEEVWLLVLRKIKDPRVLTNTMQASPELRNLLLPRRTEFLFPQVYTALGYKLEVKPDPVHSDDVDNLHPERTAPPNRPTTWFSKVLTLRSVCKSWCAVVDKYYENLPENFHYKMKLDREIPLEERDPEDRAFFAEGKKVGIWNKAKYFNTWRRRGMLSFMKDFDRTHVGDGRDKNPFIGRYMGMLVAKGTRSQHGQFSTLCRLLAKYGHHVWYCRMDLIDDFSSRTVFYSQLKTVMAFLPNLRSIRIRYVHEQAMRRGVSVNEYPKKEYLALRRYIKENPLRTFKHLKFLSIQNCPPPIFNALLTANKHVTMLQVRRECIQSGYNIFTVPLPNLKQLSIKFYTVAEFKKLEHVKWPLEKLYLNLKECPYMSWLQVLSLLENKWAPSLENLALFFPRATTSDEEEEIITHSSYLGLLLPKVRRLKLLTENIFNLDFILPMKDSLEYLEIVVAAYAYPSNMAGFTGLVGTRLGYLTVTQTISFVGYFERFEQSNIWELFPRLKGFRVDELFGERFYAYYRREDWEKKKDQGDAKPWVADIVNCWLSRATYLLRKDEKFFYQLSPLPLGGS